MNALNHLSRHTPAAAAVQQLLHDPQLPRLVNEFQAVLEIEREKRERFYEEMTEEQKVEFINGEVIVHSPAKLRHTIVSKNLLGLLDTYVQKHQLGFVGYEKMLIALTRNDYEPDIVYFGPEKAQGFTPDQTKFPAPNLVVEVLSSSTEAKDRGIKFRDYAAHGVTEYWIVDPDEEMIEQYILKDEAYHLRVKTNTGVVCSTAIEGLAVPVRAAFDEAEKLAAVRAMLADES